MDTDQGMLGLFDSDSSNFLDELTGAPAPSSLGVGVGMETGNLMDPGLPNMGGFNQMGQGQMGQLGMQQQQGPAPKLHHYDQFDQFGGGGPQKLHHMNEGAGAGMQMGNQGAAGMMSPSHQQQQFGSPPTGGGHMQSPQGSFGAPGHFGMHNSPRMASPHHQPAPQQMGIPGQGHGMPGQGQMWNQDQSAYMQPQPNQSQPQPPYNSSNSYMPHHDYGMSGNQGAPGMPHYLAGGQPSSQQSNSYGPPQLGSPPPAQRLSHMPRSTATNMGQMAQNQMYSNASYGNQPGVMNQGMGGFDPNQQHHQGFPNEGLQQGPPPGMASTNQMASNNMPPAGFPGYPNQQGPGIMGQPGMPDAPPLSHFPQSPSQNTQYRPPFPGMAQQRPTTSPRPTPPPQSHTPTGTAMGHSSSQGSFASSSLQQLEQLVPSSMGAVSTYLPPQQQQVQQPSVYSNASMGQQMNTSTGPAFAGPIMMTNGNQQGNLNSNEYSNGPMVNTSMGHMGSGGGGGPGMGQMSPVVGGGMGPMPNQHAMNVEIQQLQQQIQQLYAMQQTPQTQQKMLDLQERMRTLKAQQQQQVMQHQRKQVQMQQQQHSPMAGPRPQGPASMGPVQPPNKPPQQRGPPAQPSPRPQLSPMQQSSPQVPPSTSQPTSMPMMAPQQQQLMQSQPQVHPVGPASQAMGPTPQSMGPIPQGMGPNTPQGMPPMGPNSQGMGGVGAPPMGPTSQGMMGPQQQPGDNGQGVGSNGGVVSHPAGMAMPGQQVSLLQQQGMNQVQGQNVPPQMGQGPPMVSMPVQPGSAAQVLGQMAQANSNRNSVQAQLTDSPGEGGPLTPGEDGQMTKAQEKANRIVAEAIAKAKAHGTPVPAVMEGEVPPEVKGEVETPPAKGKKRAPRPKKEKKPKEPKEPKAPKEKRERKKKEPKTPKKPKTPKGETSSSETKDTPTKEGEEPTATPETPENKDGEKKVEPKKKTPKTPKPKPKKKGTLPTFVNKSKKKRKRVRESSDVSDLDLTPPGSPSKFAEDDPNARRSGRNTKRKKYLDDLDLNLSEEDHNGDDVVQKPVYFFVENPADEDAQIVEKLLGMRTGKRPKPKEDSEDVDVEICQEKPEEPKNTEAEPEKKEGEETGEVKKDGEEAEGETKTDAPEVTKTVSEGIKKMTEKPKLDPNIEYDEVEEFFVKYKNYSYLHCEWRTEEELLLGDKRVSMKIKRYRLKRLQNNNYFQMTEDDDLFNPDYVEVDRVLDVSVVTDPVSNEEVTHYLVKWRGLAYEDSTWELAQDVDKKKVESFYKFRELPSEEERKAVERPKASAWTQLEESANYKNNNKLRDYQLEGVNWLTFCWYNKQNCILADEMGLGKTVQSITFLQEAVDAGITGPFLVIVPLSTVGNWQREFETWTDMNVVVYHGGNASRNMIQEYELFYRDENGRKITDYHRFQALITTFEVIISDVDLLAQINWRISIIDEAHRLKNRNCKLLEGLRVFKLEQRVLLTGTPLQNNTDELFSLLNFLEPRRFASAEAFAAEFGDLKSDTQVEKLQTVLKPMMLRRLKEDVEKNLAPKEETIIEVELTNIQKKYYRAILEKNFQFLQKTGSNANLPNLMNTMMELRKCCNHPYLVNGAEDQILHEAREARGNQPLDGEALLQAMVQASGKLVLIDKLLPKLKAGNHKVLIFSQMIRVLDILEDYLLQKRYLYERLDGRIRGNLRQEAIDRFCRPASDRFAFLLCTRAGGLGINLTAADTVIIYDSDWNPQNDLQAQARCHRIGQVKAVKIYRLITRNSYEREMFDRASMKLGLDKAVLQSMRSEDKVDKPQLTKKEIEDLLKKGAYGAVMDDDKAGDEFCEEDIDQILRRRTQVITIEAEEKGSQFAKASFSVSTNRNDIDIDDPEFWEKWAKKADIDVDEIKNRNQLVIEMPRVRKQTARYGGQDSVVNMSDLESSESDVEDEMNPLPGGMRGGRGGRTRGGRGSRGTGRRGRRSRYDDDFSLEEPGSKYSRSEFFKVEKNLLVYGWGRWEDVLFHSRFKRPLQVNDVDTMARAMLLYSLKHYKGDERIKGFIWDLVTAQGGEEKDYSNHSGLSAPVPRGRKGKKAKEKSSKLQSALEEDMAKANIEDPEILITDNGYRKHLQRHANKVLLRVRLLYYLKHEIINTEAAKILSGYPYNEVDIPPPITDGDPPVYWWDEDADRCLLIGVFKHGYEKYSLMRQDPSLCFLYRCGPPDNKALLAEQNDEDGDLAKEYGDENEPEFKGDEEDEGNSSSAANTPKPAPPPADQPIEHGKLPFPSVSDINTRLRRVITGYQRNHKREQVRQAQYAKRLERKERFDLAIREREKMKRDTQQRWSRREEADFYRVVSTFGVERDPYSKKFRWETFRNLARLDKKYDDTLMEYFLAFYHMCKRVCKRFKTDEEAIPPTTLYIEPITEERASRCLARIDLLNKLREEILWHPRLEDRLKLCQSSPDFPDWWEPGPHDKELLIGACKHGLARTDYHILHDPKLVFRDILRIKQAQHAKNGSNASPRPGSISNNSNVGSPRPSQPTDLSATQSDAQTTAVIKEDAKPKLESSDTEEKKESEKSPNPTSKETKESNSEEEMLDLTTKKESTNESTSEEGEKEGDKENGEEKAEEKEDKEKEDKEKEEVVEKDEKEDKVDEKTKDDVVSEEEMKIDIPEKIDEEEKETKADEPMEVEEDEVKEKSEEKEEVKEEKPDVEIKPEIKCEEKEDETEIKAEPKVEEVKSEIKLEKEEVKAEAKVEGDGEKVEAKLLPTTPLSTPKKETSGGEQEDGTDGENGSITNYGSPAAAFLRREQLKQAEDTPEGSGLEDGYEDYEPSPAEILARSMNVPAIQWPKDRVVFHRLESIALVIEKGEWPAARRIYTPLHDLMSDSQSSTPLGGTPSGTPRVESGVHDYNLLSSADGMVRVQQVKHQYGFTESEAEDYVAGYYGDQYDHGDDPYDRERDFRVALMEGDGLKLTFQKRRKPGRRSKAEIEAERMAQMREILQGGGNSMSDGDSMSEANTSMSSPYSSSARNDSMMNGTPSTPGSTPNKALDFSPIRATDSSYLSSAEKSILAGQFPLQFPMKKRRGRKRKIDKLLEAAAMAQHQARLAQAQAHTEEAQAHAAAMAQAAREAQEAALREAAIREAMAKRERPAVSLDPDERVTVINLEDGSILRGGEAPRRRDLEKWLEDHPGYMVDRADPEEEVEAALEMSLEGKKKKRRPRSDPNKLDLNNLSGYENVSVINRDTGKKITGAKAPPLKYLNEWLIQNSSYDVDGKWAGVVAAYGKLSSKLTSRILPPTEGVGRGRGRGRPPMSKTQTPGGEFPYPVNSMNALGGLTSANMMAAAAAAGFPKLATMPMPFAGLHGLGLTNAMYGMPGFGVMPGSSLSASGMEDGKDEEAKAKDSDNDSDDGGKSSGSSSKPHPSFPFMYNPMMFNPLFAQSGMGNFSLPMGLPTSFASLAQHAQAQQQLLNGMKDSDDDEPPAKVHVKEKASASSSSKDVDMVAEDLSVRRKPSSDRPTTASSTSSSDTLSHHQLDDDQPTNLVIKDKHKDRQKHSHHTSSSHEHKDRDSTHRSHDGGAAQSLNLSKDSSNKATPSSSPASREASKKLIDRREGLVKELVSRVKEKKKSKLDSIISGIFAKVGDKKEEKNAKPVAAEAASATETKPESENCSTKVSSLETEKETTAEET